jgi:hypothetical protein
MKKLNTDLGDFTFGIKKNIFLRGILIRPHNMKNKLRKWNILNLGSLETQSD